MMLPESDPLRSCEDGLEAGPGVCGNSEVGIGGDRWVYILLRPAMAGRVPEFSK